MWGEPPMTQCKVNGGDSPAATKTEKRAVGVRDRVNR